MRQPAALSNASTITRPHRRHWRQTDIVVLRDRLGHNTGYLPSVPPGLPSPPTPAHRASRLARRRRSTAWEDYNHSRLIGSPRLTSKSLLCNVFVIVPATTRHRWRPAGPARPPRSRVLRRFGQLLLALPVLLTPRIGQCHENGSLVARLACACHIAGGDETVDQLGGRRTSGLGACGELIDRQRAMFGEDTHCSGMRQRHRAGDARCTAA